MSTATDTLAAELLETAAWLDERAEVIRHLADRGRVANRQDLRDEAKRFEARAFLLRLTVERAKAGAP